MKNFLLLFIISFFLMGCRKPEPTPEVRDPIYQSIKKELKSAEDELKSVQEELKGNEYNIDKIEPYTRQSKTFWDKVWKSQRAVRKAEQKVHYLNLHLINRKYAARNSYLRAFNLKNEENWPSQNQFNRYEQNKRLKNASRKWDSENIARQINSQ